MIVNFSENIFLAVARGDTATVARKIAEGEDVNNTNEDGENPLHVAIRCDQEKMARLLLSHGANPNGSGKFSITPLFCAIDINKKYFLKMLLDAGANPFLRNKSGDTPAHVWMSKIESDNPPLSPSGSIDFSDIELLVAKGIPIDQRGKNGYTLLMHAVAQGKETTIIDGLLRLGADISAFNNMGAQAIHMATIKPKRGAFAHLVSHGADINARDWNGHSPLHWCYSSEVAPELISLGATVDAQCIDGDTHLMKIVRLGKLGGNKQEKMALVMLLLEAGANPDCATPYGITPRSYASKKNHVDMLELFAASDAKKAMQKVVYEKRKNP